MNNFFVFYRKDGLEVPSYEIGSFLEKPIITRATRNIKHIAIEGRNGTLTEDDKTYNNIEISFRLINHKENILEKEVLGLLDGTGGELKISYLNGTYKVKEINTFTVSEDINNVFRVDLTFVCEPFRHLDETVIPLKINNNNINVDGNVETDHITTIYGNGDISLFINNEQIVFKDVIGYITIDTERMICYKDSTPANNKMIGEFIKLKSGLNTISWIGTVTTVEIKYRGRFLN